MEEEIDRLDRAFEWVVLFLTLSYATVFQFLSWFLVGSELAIVMQFIIRTMFVPLVIIVFLWLGKFVSVGLRKMFFRKLAWSWGMFQLGLCVWVTMFLSIMDASNERGPFRGILPNIVLVLNCIFVPFLAFVLYRKIMKKYEKATSEDIFWKSKRWNYGATIVAVLSIVFFWILLCMHAFLVSRSL